MGVIPEPGILPLPAVFGPQGPPFPLPLPRETVFLSKSCCPCLRCCDTLGRGDQTPTLGCTKPFSLVWLVQYFQATNFMW